MHIGQFFEHALRVSDEGKIRLASKLFPSLFLSVLIVTILAFAALEAESRETTTASGIAEQDVPQYDDAWYLKQLLARDSADTDPVKWIFDVVDNPANHPLIQVIYADETPFVFAALFDIPGKKIVLRVDRTFIRTADPHETSLVQRDMARLQFVREATLAMLLEQGKGLELYLSCAIAEPPDTNCFRMLLTVHLMALQAEWRYAQSRELTRVFPESVARDRDEFIRQGVSPGDAELRALAIYGLQGQLRNLFWAGRYEEFLDETAAQSAAD